MRTEIKILLLASCTLLLFAQCSTDDTITSYKEQQELVETTLAVDLPQVGFTRAEPKYDSSKGALYNLRKFQYIRFSLWYKPKNKDEYMSDEKIIKLSDYNDNCDFQLQLIKNVEYDFLVWADFNSTSEGFLEASPTNIQLRNYGGYPSSNATDTDDAFYGKECYKITNDITSYKVKLKRPLTKIRFFLTEIDDQALEEIEFTYPLHSQWSRVRVLGYYKSLNIANSSIKPENHETNFIYQTYWPNPTGLKGEVELAIVYLYLPEQQLTLPEMYVEMRQKPYTTILHLPVTDLSKKIDTDGNPIKSLNNKLITIEASIYAQTVLKVTIDSDFDSKYIQ